TRRAQEQFLSRAAELVAQRLAIAPLQPQAGLAEGLDQLTHELSLELLLGSREQSIARALAAEEAPEGETQFLDLLPRNARALEPDHVELPHARRMSLQDHEGRHVLDHARHA